MGRPLNLILVFTITIPLFFSEPIDAATKPRGFVVPLAKHGYSNFYFSQIDLGLNATVSTNFVVNLGGDFTWYVCPYDYNSSSYRRVTSSSPKCKLLKSSYNLNCNYPPGRSCFSHSCAVDTYNPIGDISFQGALGQDTFAFRSNPDSRRFHTPRLILACVTTDLGDGLPANTFGMLSLSKHLLSLPMQLASQVKTPRKFALCMPSKPDKWGFGGIFIGGGPYPVHASKLLTTTTKMITNPVSTAKFHAEGEPSYEYYMDVRFVKIGGEVVAFDASLLSIDKKGNGGTKFSTVDTYTVLHTSIYRPLVEAFKAKAKAKNMVLAEPSSPLFTTCFSSKSVPMGATGPDVPVIDLMLQSGGSWRIYGSNSMVPMYKDIMCLAFVDGGTNPGSSIVLGGYQMEDHLLEFDIESSKISFTSSLLLHNTSCSDS